MTLHESSSIANIKIEFSNSMDEYVIVEQVDEFRDDDRSRECDRGDAKSGGDDASYDYCDDAIPHGEDDDDDEDDDDENTVASHESETAQKDSFMLSVPSGLMKDLDEAHAAAKLACYSEEEAGKEDSSQFCEPFFMLNSCNKPTETQSSTDDAAVKISTVASKTKNQAKANTPTATITNFSRASNKKRRKQLKLVKKAQVAATAAQALSARAVAKPRANKGHQVAASPSSSIRSSCKVTNIAVACARETMASYRQELLCSSVS